MKTAPTPAHFAHLRDRYTTIVAFGDSITAVNHTTHGGLNWVGYLSQALNDRRVFPQGYIVINSGIGGNQLCHGLERLDRDVLRFDPDIVIIGFGLNDANHITPRVFKQRLRDMVRRIRKGRAECSIVLRTFHPRIDMMTGGALTQWLENGKIVKSDLAPFARAIREVAREEKTLLVDHFKLWMRSTASSCRGDLIRLMSDPIHPNNLGHRRLYHEIAPLFHADRHFYYEWERLLENDGQL